MKQHQWIAALAAVGLLALALPVRAQVGADGVKAQTLTGQRLVGVKADLVQKVIGADGEGSGLNVTDTARDRNLDFGVTNLITSVAIDTGGTGGANSRTSAVVDVRKYTTGRIIIHITQSAAGDTLGHYFYGVTVFPLTSGTMDWTATGVPISTNPSPAANDTLGFTGGFDGITANAIAAFSGERIIVLSTDRTTSNYANVYAGQTASFSWDTWLGAGARPRYLAVQVRMMSRDAASTLPSVRVDLEGLR